MGNLWEKQAEGNCSSANRIIFLPEEILTAETQRKKQEAPRAFKLSTFNVQSNAEVFRFRCSRYSMFKVFLFFLCIVIPKNCVFLANFFSACSAPLRETRAKGNLVAALLRCVSAVKETPFQARERKTGLICLSKRFPVTFLATDDSFCRTASKNRAPILAAIL